MPRSLARALRRIRLDRRMDRAALAARLNLSPLQLRFVEDGILFPPAAQRRAWAAALGYADLLEFDRCWRPPAAGDGRAARATPAGLIPIVNAVPAGPPVDYHEFGIDTAVGLDYVPRADTPEQQSADFLFAVIVVGDSMSPAFADGDLIILRPLAIDEPLPDGSPVFVRFAATRDHTCTFKRIFRIPDSGDDAPLAYELRPDNPHHATMRVAPDEIDRIAIALERRPAYARRHDRAPRRIADQYAQAAED